MAVAVALAVAGCSVNAASGENVRHSPSLGNPGSSLSNTSGGLGVGRSRNHSRHSADESFAHPASAPTEREDLKSASRLVARAKSRSDEAEKELHTMARELSSRRAQLELAESEADRILQRLTGSP